MNAILKKVGTDKTKPITGKVVQNGLNRITLVVNNSDGTQAMKGFSKDKYVITYL